MLEIKKEYILKVISDYKKKAGNQRLKFDSVIRPFLSDHLTKKQQIELCQVGNFLTLLEKPCQIVKHSDSPDFIILYDGDKIGLEHVRLLRVDTAEKTKPITQLFNDAAVLFKKKYPNHNVLVNFWLKSDRFTFSKSESNKLKEEISDYIFHKITIEQSEEKPSYIDDILIMNHSQVSFCYNPGAYYVNSLDKHVLENTILKKDRLIEKYVEESGILRQWLLIVIGSASPDSFEYSDNQFHLGMNSKFEKVFLMEDLNEKIWQIL